MRKKQAAARRIVREQKRLQRQQGQQQGGVEEGDEEESEDEGEGEAGLGDEQQQQQDGEEDDGVNWATIELPSKREEAASRAWLKREGKLGELYNLAYKGKHPKEWDKVSTAFSGPWMLHGC